MEQQQQVTERNLHLSYDAQCLDFSEHNKFLLYSMTILSITGMLICAKNR